MTENKPLAILYAMADDICRIIEKETASIRGGDCLITEDNDGTHLLLKHNDYYIEIRSKELEIIDIIERRKDIDGSVIKNVKKS